MGDRSRLPLGPVTEARTTPCSRGLIVALVGPDGAGKTSQTAQLTETLKKRSKCAAVYLGCGDGGWSLRQSCKQLLRRWSARPPKQRSAAEAPSRLKINDSVRTALRGVIIALERYRGLRRAARLAAYGSIVISDRWPQNIQPGLFDGPLSLHPRASSLVQLFSRVERYLYCRMETYKPSVMVHLVSDFETSNARKPGDRSRSEFEQRLALMKEMRRRNPGIKVVDARNGFDEVTSDLLQCISVALAQQARSTKARRPAHHFLWLIVVPCLGNIHVHA